jgi:hypothetical protein
MTKISELCGTRSLGFLKLREGSVSISEQMLPLAKVAAEAKFSAILKLEITQRSMRLPDVPAVSDALRYSLQDC